MSKDESEHSMKGNKYRHENQYEIDEKIQCLNKQFSSENNPCCNYIKKQRNTKGTLKS